MKIGVLVFGYQNFKPFEQQMNGNGFFTCNLGDNMQSIASRLLLEELGLSKDDIISVNRDNLRNYSGIPVALIMNGVFEAWCFPLPKQITPIFVGFCASEATITANLREFESHQPIGCRDRATADIFLKHGIRAYVSGCITLTIPKRKNEPRFGRVTVIYGGSYSTGASDHFPSSLFKSMPRSFFDETEFIYHRLPVSSWPFDEDKCLNVESYARSLLSHYSENSRLVITSLHHAATPCMALGIPVIICRSQMDPRFSFLTELLPIYTTSDVFGINWHPKPVYIEPIRQLIRLMIREKIYQYRDSELAVTSR